MKKETKNSLWIIAFVICVVCAIGLFIGLLFSINNMENNDFIEFKTEIVEISQDLTEYQMKKLNYIISLYYNEDTFGMHCFEINDFERFVKKYDFDFWYDIFNSNIRNKI